MASTLFLSRLHRLLYFEPTIDRLSKRKSAWWLQAEIVWCNDVIIWLKLAVPLQKPAWICCVCVSVCVPQRALNAERGHMQGYKIGFRCVLKTHQEPAIPARALHLNVNVSHKLYEMPRGCLPEHTMHLMWEDICSTCNKHRKKKNLVCRKTATFRRLFDFGASDLSGNILILAIWVKLQSRQTHDSSRFYISGGNWDLNVQKWQYSPAAHANEHLGINPKS